LSETAIPDSKQCKVKLTLRLNDTGASIFRYKQYAEFLLSTPNTVAIFTVVKIMKEKENLMKEKLNIVATLCDKQYKEL
jgi:hypothetical protein